ncbi:MAG: sigma-70 family RNA polymerase sigma factor [Proteobacteria bacterium]|nr:sigma-70 family RNA polymerase sigma factor [Pseudomonadota bacterium]
MHGVPNKRTLALYTAHRRKLLEYANGIVGDPGRAEDVVQEAFLRFRTAATERFLDEPVGYLYRVVRNLALDRRRREVLEDRYIVSDVEVAAAVVADERPSPEQEAIARADLQRVMNAMSELPERTRIAMEMHRFGGCTLKEIADHLGISISMAQVLVMDGVRHCQRAL